MTFKIFQTEVELGQGYSANTAFYLGFLVEKELMKMALEYDSKSRTRIEMEIAPRAAN